MEPSDEPGLGLADAGTGDDANGQFDQSLIDSFLGLNAGDMFAPMASGIDAIVHAPSVQYQRIPLLEAVFDRLVKLLQTSTRKITSDMVEVRLDRVTSMRFGQYLDSIPLPSLIGVVKAQPWNNFALITVDSSLVYALIDVVFGGNADLKPPSVDGRSFSLIEMSVLRKFVESVLSNAEEAFSFISPVHFSVDHFETNPRFASITQPQSIVILATFKIELGNLLGFFDIVLPLVTLEPIREQLLQGSVGDLHGKDEAWERHLVAEVSRSEARITAVLHEMALPLGRVMDLTVGETLLFDVTPDHPVALRCDDRLIAHGKIGRQGDRVAIRLAQPVIGRVSAEADAAQPGG